MAAPMASHPSAGLLKSIPGSADDLGEKKAHLEARSYFLRLFLFCSLFVEDKGGRRLEVGTAEADEV